MKTIFTLLICATLSTSSFGNYTFINNEPERIVKYELKQENALVLPTDFAKEFIVSKEQLEKLNDQKIYHVELVYTAFKSSPDFDQVKLNENRMNQIMKLIPQLKTDLPTWSLVEQTGAVTREVANTYFHGFVIHYGSGLAYTELSDFFGDYQQPSTHFDIDNKVGGQFKYSSGTVLNIPANAVTYENGNIVTGDYQLTYREYRNPAEIAFSGIPMTYTTNGEEFNFSSVGMYEITAQKDGKELNLQQPIIVDFNCVENKKDVSFYQMNNEGEWKVLNEINFGENNIGNNNSQINEEAFPVNGAIVEVSTSVSNSVITKNKTRHGGEKNIEMETLTMKYNAGEKTTTATMNHKAWNSYQKLKIENDSIFNSWVVSESTSERTVEVLNKYFQQFNTAVMRQNMFAMEGNMIPAIGTQINRGPTPNNIGSTMLASGINEGHTYPTIVRGLNSPEFGVYNCDQIYRIGNTVALTPTYVDESGNEIANKHVACVIDLSYNGAFSFHPNHLTCNQDGRNVILLFTQDKNVFMLSEQAFAALDKTNLRPALVMKNVTNEIKSTEDLKAMMGI